MTHDDYAVEVICPVCGNEFDCSAREANAAAAPCCSDVCQQEWSRPGGLAEQEARSRESERNYRCGYDYACGYHD